LQGLVSALNKLVFAYGTVLLAIMRIAADSTSFVMGEVLCDRVETHPKKLLADVTA
jgi:hypothetical protein